MTCIIRRWGKASCLSLPTLSYLIPRLSPVSRRIKNTIIVTKNLVANLIRIFPFFLSYVNQHTFVLFYVQMNDIHSVGKFKKRLNEKPRIVTQHLVIFPKLSRGLSSAEQARKRHSMVLFSGIFEICNSIFARKFASGGTLFT